MFGNRKRKIIDIYHYSDKGDRKRNEDTCAVYQKKEKEYLFAVADGLGGHGEGARASQLAVNTMLENFKEIELNNPEQLSDWFQDCNKRILNIQTTNCQMKTTLVVLHIKDNLAMWAHIGDTRLYHFVDGKISDQTCDHSVSQMAVFSGEIKPEEIRGHIDRNRLLRAIGSDQNNKAEISDRIELRGKSHAFLLCTDGFWEYVYEHEMEEAFSNASTAEEWINNMLIYVRKRIKQENDNNTAIAVIVNRK
ncbi:MAG: PP2C family protein-serine/threonine phosphatase [Acetatifactor sp.]